MAKYEKGFNFNTPEELKDYIDWVAKTNNASRVDAFNAIRNDGTATLGGKSVKDMAFSDDVLLRLFPETKPNKFEEGYTAPKSLKETMKDEIVTGIKDDITKWPERQFWKMATHGYYNGEDINLDKILKDVGFSNKGGKKQDNKENTSNASTPEKTQSSKEEVSSKEGQKKPVLSDSEKELMKFGNNAVSQEQINSRDKILAREFIRKGITTAQQVEEALNGVTSFKNASRENKIKTIERILGNIKSMQKTNNDNVNDEEERPAWIFTDQEDYKGTPAAKEGLDMYNKYAQAEAESGDSTKVLRDMMGEAPTSSNTTPIMRKLKDAGLSTAQVNDFIQAWADAYYQVDQESSINI